MHNVSYLSHNWLILRINNEDVRHHVPMMRGVVYDLGCGVRPYEEDILQVAEAYVGVDWANTLHDLNADVVADLNKPLPIENMAADTVVSFQVMEHLCEPQVMLGEAFRILKSGGRMFVSVPFQWWVHEQPHDYFRYTRHGLEYIFSKAGFVDIEVKESSGFWSMWFLKLNYQTWHLIRGPWPIRSLLRLLFLPFWFGDQLLASWLDKFWPEKGETACYFITARKP